MGKKKIGGKHLIILSSILVLNTMGMSYAYWTDQLQINTTFSTGSIEPTFCRENYWINIIRDGSDEGNYQGWNDKWINDSDLSKLDIEVVDNETIIISGTLETGYKAFIHYCVVNNGTIPIKYINEAQQLDLDGLTVLVNQQSKILDPQEMLYTEHSNANPKMQIQVPNKLDKELNQKFEIDLPFYQWTGNDIPNEGWQKELKIIGNITVVPENIIDNINMEQTTVTDTAIEPIEHAVEQQVPLTEVIESIPNLESAQTQSSESTNQTPDIVGNEI